MCTVTMALLLPISRSAERFLCLHHTVIQQTDSSQNSIGSLDKGKKKNLNENFMVKIILFYLFFVNKVNTAMLMLAYVGVQGIKTREKLVLGCQCY